jgi:hypothetical protein
MNYLLAISFALVLASSAHAADISKAQATAEFRLKVATCKADAGKPNSSDFYRRMADCVDKVTVTVASAK